MRHTRDVAVGLGTTVVCLLVGIRIVLVQTLVVLVECLVSLWRLIVVAIH